MCCSRRLANGPAVLLAHLLTLAETNWRDNKTCTQEVSEITTQTCPRGSTSACLGQRVDACGFILFGPTKLDVKHTVNRELTANQSG